MRAAFETYCPVGDHRVQVLPSDIRTTPESYGFPCPGCHVTVWKPCSERTQDLLYTGGVDTCLTHRDLTMFRVRLELSPHHDHLAAVAQAEVDA